MALNFRQLYRLLLPSWLGGENPDGTPHDGTRVAHSITMMIDATLERMVQARDARFPSRAGASSLSELGRDRGIPRGRSETAPHYAQRLIRWRFPKGHRVRGNSFAYLEQISEYWGGLLAWVVDVSRNRRVRTAAGVISYSRAYAWDWDGAAASPNWGRYWVVLEAPAIFAAHPEFGDASLWGGDLGVDGYTIGQLGATPEDAAAMRRLVRPPHAWKLSGVRAEWLVINLDGTTQTPDGTWANWSHVEDGVRVPSRYAGWRYWSLTPEANNVYTPDPDGEYAYASEIVDGTTYTPDGNTWHDTVVMQDGSTYTPDSDTFHESVPLLDDGDAPECQ